jgi:hypothetical protein
MNSIAIGAIVFVCTFAGAMIGMTPVLGCRIIT